MPSQPHKTPRKKLPKRLAVIDPDSCTGCEACVEVCPVDCIELHTLAPGVKGVDAWCEIDFDRCIGCELCIHLPRKKSEVYLLLVCPWDAIEMVTPEELPGVVAQLGGPPEYVAANRQHWLDSAQRQAQAARTD